MLQEVFALQGPGGVDVHSEALGDETADAQAHLFEQVAGGRVERVVQIEDPDIDMVECGG